MPFLFFVLLLKIGCVWWQGQSYPNSGYHLPLYHVTKVYPAKRQQHTFILSSLNLYVSLSVSLSRSVMSRGTDRLVKNLKKFADAQYKLFTTRYGQQLIDIFEFPIKVVLSPFTLAYDIAGSAPRGFGVPEIISKISYASIFVSVLYYAVFYVLVLFFL